MQKTVLKLPPVKNFYVQSGLFTVLSLGSAVASYALYPILVRLLSHQAFGDFAVASAMLNQTLAVLLAINIISIHLVKKYGEDEARQHAQVIQKALIWVFLGVCILVVTLSPFLQSLFRVENPLLFLPLIIILLTSIPAVVWNGYLQGNKELVRIGVFSLGSSLAKLLFAALLGVIAGSVGAVFGILVGTLVGIAILQLYPGVRLPSFRSAFEKTNRGELRFLNDIKLYVLQASFVVGALGILQGYDISLAKAVFEPNIAGQYSGISVLGAAFYYLGLILIWIILPEIAIKDPGVNRRLLGTAYRLFGAILIVALLGELLLGNLLLPLLLGDTFEAKTELLIFATLYQLTLVAIALYSFFLLICRRNRVILLVGLVLTMCLFIPPHFATTPLAMVQTLWISMISAVTVYWVIASIYRLMSGSAAGSSHDVIQ